MSVKITGKASGKLDAKRLRLGGVTARSVCPDCGQVAKQDLGGWHYLHDPPVNEPFDLHFYCSDDKGDGCSKEWTERVILRVSLEVPK